MKLRSKADAIVPNKRFKPSDASEALFVTPGARKPPPRISKEKAGALVVGAMGLALGLVCALFPWYIFFNQEKFGIQALTFEGGQSGRPSANALQPQMVMQPFATGDVPQIDLDFLPTATLTDDPEARRAVPVAEQPFPADRIEYRLVHVANGRAMIEDEAGLWVVQPGSRLPDSSVVSRIERRGTEWVLVTSTARELSLAQ